MLFFTHVGLDVIEQRRTEIALAGIGKHGEYRRSLFRGFANLERAGESRTAGDADEYAFLGCQRFRQANCIVALDRDDAVDEFRVDRVFGQLGNEVRAPALHQVGAEQRMAVDRRAVGEAFLLDAAAEYWRIVRLANDDLGIGALFLQHARDAFQRAAGTESGDPVIEPLTLEIVKNLRCRSPRMRIGVRLVFELAAQEPAMLFCQLDRLGEHAAAFQCCRGQHDLGAEETHHLAPLDAEVLGHRHHERVALRRADHGEADAGVAARRLDDRLARLQRARLFGIFDDAQRQAVLDRTHRVEGFDLDVEIDALGRQLVDANDGRMADRFEYVFVCLSHKLKSVQRGLINFQSIVGERM